MNQLVVDVINWNRHFELIREAFGPGNLWRLWVICDGRCLSYLGDFRLSREKRGLFESYLAYVEMGAESQESTSFDSKKSLPGQAVYVNRWPITWRHKCILISPYRRMGIAKTFKKFGKMQLVMSPSIKQNVSIWNLIRATENHKNQK